MSPTVAVLDLGSNSIKVLVATRGEAGAVVPLLSKTLDVRISAGISLARPRLSDEGMARGLAAVQELLADAAAFSPARTLLVATSAVRDAINGTEFTRQIRTATGAEVRILSGHEEADAIGRGLICDPALSDLGDFHVFDLGGGSLECLSFRVRSIRQAVSLPLGCVRLTEKFLPSNASAFTGAIRQAVMAHVKTVLDNSGFSFNQLPVPSVGTGGTVATVRAIYGMRAGLKTEATAAVVTVAQLRELLDQLAPMPLEQRRQVPGLPPARADVFPTALATILALAEHSGVDFFLHSFHNLRFGLAAALLEPPS